MKNIKFYSTLLFALCFAACQLPAQTTESRSVDHFNSIAISGDFETVFLEEGSESVKLKGSESDLEKVIVENDGNKLSIKVKKRQHLRGKVTVHIGYDELVRIASSGSSDFETRSTIKTEDLNIAFSGSGDFEGSLDVQNLKIAISGSADFDLDGYAKNQRIAISGSGDVDASNLHGETANVAISGSGDVDLHVSGKVKSAVSGSGDVSNRGK